MARINPSILQLKPSATLAINQKVKQLRAENRAVNHFGFGQSPFPVHDSIVKSLKDNATNNHYLPTVGLEALRKEIANFLYKYQSIEANSDFIYIGPGSKELLYQTIVVLEGIFLIPQGSWVSYGPQIYARNGRYDILETTLENNFKLTPEVLDAHCLNNPDVQKSLILNSPNNPTGAVYSHEELEKLAEVCRQNNVIVLSDEIYSQINFNDNFSPSISQYYPEKTIVFGGLSKVFSAGGYRLGFMVLPKDLQSLHEAVRSMFSETFSAVAAPIQYAAVKAYKMSSGLQAYIRDCAAVLSGISKYVYSTLINAGLQCTCPQGAFYMMIGFNDFRDRLQTLGLRTSSELADYLLENYQTALLPASDFYFGQEDFFFRLAFVDFDGASVLKAFRSNTEIDKSFVEQHCPNIFRGLDKLLEFKDQMT